MVKGTTKSLGNKEFNDKFYTKENIVETVFEYIQEVLEFKDFDVVIEPSAGSGNFSNVLQKLHHNVIAYDLVPEGENIIDQNWLTLDKNTFKDMKVLVVGNPPFGTSGNLAQSFIKESSFAEVIAFILPKSFKKESVKARIPKFFHCILEKDLPVDAFTLNGEDYKVPTVFQIWKKDQIERTLVKGVKTTELFKFVNKEDADFRIQRVGGNAGKADLNKNFAKSSNYFVKNTSTLSTLELIEMINNTTFPSIDDVSGPRSLSKAELITSVEETVKNKSSKN